MTSELSKKIGLYFGADVMVTLRASIQALERGEAHHHVHRGALQHARVEQHEPELAQTATHECDVVIAGGSLASAAAAVAVAAARRAVPSKAPTLTF